MGFFYKKLRWPAIILIFLFICLAASFIIWLYSGSITKAKEKVFSTLPLPIALVNYRPVMAKDYFLRSSLAQKNFSIGQTPITSGAIYSQIILEEIIRQIAAGKGLFVTNKELGRELQNYSAQENLSGLANFKDLLKAYGISEGFFVNQVVASPLLLTKLQVWFYSQPDLNSEYYKTAQTLLDKINTGTDFGDLAKQYSQNKIGKDLQGDMGFILDTQLIPELRDIILNMRDGEVKILPSRYGLQIIKLEGRSGNLWHVKQIFLQGSNFNSWLSKQENSYKVTKLLNF